MQFSKKTLLTAALASSTALAAPAAVTVTEHVHQVATVTVQGVEYVTDGVTKTTFINVGGAVNYASTLTPIKPTISALADADVTNNVVATTATATASASASEKGKLDTFKSIFSKLAKAKTTSTTAAPTTTTAAAPTTTASPATTKKTTLAPTTTQKQTTKAATTSTKAAETTKAAAKSDSNLSDFASTMLNEHNKKRALHKDTSALSWSSELASYAQNYADNFDCSGNLVHSGGPYGENLALGYDATGAVDAWYGEISNYDFSNPGTSSNTGHFTQVVWKGTSKVGCGIKTCDNVWGHYVICSYQNAGNVGGQYGDNVMSLL